MKAINFLEWFKSVGNVMSIEKMRQIHLFYSTPFKPEMITELLEGWKENESDRDIDPVTNNIIGKYYEREKQPYFADICFPMLDVEMFVKVAANCGEDWDTVDIEFLYPETLNDFISDCNRADIELNWKPEIITKYFS